MKLFNTTQFGWRGVAVLQTNLVLREWTFCNLLHDKREDDGRFKTLLRVIQPDIAKYLEDAEQPQHTPALPRNSSKEKDKLVLESIQRFMAKRTSQAVEDGDGFSLNPDESVEE